jgi:hypothetical protein
MHRVLASVLCGLALLALCTSPASATMSNYAFQVTTGSVLTPSFTDLVAGQSGRRTSTGYYNTVFGVTLPFTFVLDGVSYSRLSVSTNGLISLGTGNVATTGSNSLISTSSTQGQFPRIAAYWDQLYVTGGATRYCSGRAPAIRTGTSGSAPNRIFVVDFKDLEVAGYTAAYSSWQVRFFEGTNSIEFFYTDLTSRSCRFTSSIYSTSATIGIADASSDYLSITPNGASATASTSSAFNSVNQGNTAHRIPANTIYRFTPCNVSLAGNPAQGGTANMTNGDTLLATQAVQRGNTTGLMPVTIGNSTTGCASRTFTMAISGPNAGDYSLSTTGGSLSPGATVTPVITFTPSGLGVRRATLTIADNNGLFRSYPLAATGLTRIGYTGNLLDGGTIGMTSGDSLMANVLVLRGSTGTYSPFTITNTNANALASPAGVTVSIDSAGFPSTQYAIVGPTTASLGAGQTFTPQIQFNPTGVGPQDARLVVNADGEVRTYTLRAISQAPAISVTTGGIAIGPDNPVLNQLFACVGEVVTTIPVSVTNIGTLPLVVSDIDFYLTDTTYQQGTPMLPLVRDAMGGLVPVRDYVLSDVPGMIPLSATPTPPTPFVVEAGQVRQMYLTFIGQVPGKRFARAFIRTNAENIFGLDTNAYDNTTTFPVSTEGLFVTDLLGRAHGSQLSIDGAGLRLKPIVFPGTRVGDTSLASFTIANAGSCDLRIARHKFRVTSGDINEIKLIQALRTARVDGVTGDYVLAPGMVDTVVVQFVPSRSGTRMATLMIQTNDSTIYRPGIAERGTHYLDLSGRGLAGLEARELVLAPVAIGNSVTGTVVLTNELNVAVPVSSISFDGDDAAEFAQDGTSWPSLPHTVLPGSKLNLSVRLTPAAGSQPGMRRTTMVLVTSSGDSVRVPIRGEAGTQSLVVSPSSLFETITIAVGQTSRQTLMISNNGTLPVHVSSLMITGPDSASYRLGQMPRRDLEAGQTEYLEVTYAPTTPGQSTAAIEVTDMAGNVYSVVLGGNALRIRRDPVDVPTHTRPTDHGPVGLQRRDEGPELK